MTPISSPDPIPDPIAARIAGPDQSTWQPAPEGDPGPLTPALAELDGIALPPTDDTPNDAPPEPSAHIPHLGHALLFLALTGALLLATQGLLLGLTHPHTLHQIDPKLLIASEAVTYVLTLAASFFLFPRLWQRPFLTGLHWNAPAARRNLLRLIPLGLLLSAITQATSSLLPIPKDLPMNDFFRTTSDLWILSLFGTLLAPLFEEVLFRGFLLPAFAIAYDWLCLPRTEAAVSSWQSSNALSRNALLFSGILSSVLFALLHGAQTAFTWPVLALLFVVSLILTTVRIRLRSVAASTLVHASYNGLVFLAAFLVTGGYRHLDKLPK